MRKAIVPGILEGAHRMRTGRKSEMTVDAAEILVHRTVKVLLLHNDGALFTTIEGNGNFATVAAEAILVSPRKVADTLHRMGTMAFCTCRFQGLLLCQTCMELIIFHGMAFCAEPCRQRTILLLAFIGAMRVVFGAKAVAGRTTDDPVY